MRVVFGMDDDDDDDDDDDLLPAFCPVVSSLWREDRSLLFRRLNSHLGVEMCVSRCDMRKGQKAKSQVRATYNDKNRERSMSRPQKGAEKGHMVVMTFLGLASHRHGRLLTLHHVDVTITVWPRVPHLSVALGYPVESTKPKTHAQPTHHPLLATNSGRSRLLGLLRLLVQPQLLRQPDHSIVVALVHEAVGSAVGNERQ